MILQWDSRNHIVYHSVPGVELTKHRQLRGSRSHHHLPWYRQEQLRHLQQATLAYYSSDVKLPKHFHIKSAKSLE